MFLKITVFCVVTLQMVTANTHTKAREIINNKPQLAEKRKHLQLGGELVLDLNTRRGFRLIYGNGQRI